jgi:hypothetical protein
MGTGETAVLDRPVNDRGGWLGLALLLSVLVAFHLTFINRFFPLQEGWFQYYSDLISRGEVMYRDFYMFIPPLFPLEMHLVDLVSQGSFLAFRVYGLAQRLLLAAMIYRLLLRYFPQWQVWIATLVGMVVYSSNMQDIVYGYYQSSLLVATISLALLVRTYESLVGGGARSAYWAAATGFGLGVTFLYKQSVGVLFAVAVSVLFVGWLIWGKWVGTRKATAWYFVGMLVPVGVCFSWLAANDALIPFFEQVFGGASSKGQLADVLFGFLSRQFEPGVLVAFGLLGVALVFLWWAKKHSGTQRWLRVAVAVCALLMVGTALWSVGYKPTSAFWADASKSFFRYYLLLLAVAGVLSLVDAFAVRRGAWGKLRRYRQPVYMVAMGGLAVAGIAAMEVTTPAAREALFSSIGFFELKRVLVEFTFLFAVLMILVQLVSQVTRRKPVYDVGLWILVAGSVVWMWAHGMSGSIEEHAVSLALPIMICVLLSVPAVGMWLKAAVVSLVVLMLLPLTTAQRLSVPYWWWGWAEPPITRTNDVPINVDRLQGFRVSQRTATAIETVDDLIRTNTTVDSTVYTFPHLTLFNTLTGRLNTGTFASVHYWDVCPDAVASADARRLAANPPDIIVWTNMGEDVWTTHEDLFRNGQRSGQRDIQEVVQGLVATDYVKLGTVENIDVWKHR